ncbi:MFS transporter [Nakamurella antarctica]|uniref:MFS transporter n=1 Tax=Nakamurella antarctica TaxID=1902245 RepID=UPI0013DE3D2A|nr:MFS transporter [Nakamurella antarctica]
MSVHNKMQPTGLRPAAPGPSSSDTSTLHHEPPPPSVRGLVPLLRLAGLRRLVGIRVVNSLGEGGFQGALVGAVLFNPQKQASPAAIAAGFAIILLPYSLIGPFLGSLLDRWSRRQVLVWSNLLRSIFVLAVAAEIAAGAPLWLEFSTALLVMGAGRFIGSGLSAAMPHTVAADSLVGANSLATTAGAISGAAGGAATVGLGTIFGDQAISTALVTAGVIPFFLAASYLALGYTKFALGPSETDEPAQTTKAIIGGLTAGFTHMRQRPTIAVAISMVMLVRFCYGLGTMLVLLLFRNYFEATGFWRAGQAGIVQALGFAAAGLFVGAVVTAPAVRWMTRTRWVVSVLGGGAIMSVVLSTHMTSPLTMITAFVLGFSYQSTKICADAIVQRDADDAHIGRVYALYDTTNNILFVAAFVLGAILLPPMATAPPWSSWSRSSTCWQRSDIRS